MAHEQADSDRSSKNCENCYRYGTRVESAMTLMAKKCQEFCARNVPIVMFVNDWQEQTNGPGEIAGVTFAEIKRSIFGAKDWVSINKEDRKWHRFHNIS